MRIYYLCEQTGRIFCKFSATFNNLLLRKIVKPQYVISMPCNIRENEGFTCFIFSINEALNMVLSKFYHFLGFFLHHIWWSIYHFISVCFLDRYTTGQGCTWTNSRLLFQQCLHISEIFASKNDLKIWLSN